MKSPRPLDSFSDTEIQAAHDVLEALAPSPADFVSIMENRDLSREGRIDNLMRKHGTFDLLVRLDGELKQRTLRKSRE